MLMVKVFFLEGSISIKKDNKNTAMVYVSKEDIFLSNFYSHDLTHHVNGFVFTFLCGSHLQNLLLKENMLSETTTKAINLFSKDSFKLSQERLVKTAINNCIKKLTFGFLNESYFLYDKSNLIKQTFVTKINKLLSIYGCISYFDK